MNFPHTLIYRQCVTGGLAVRGAALPASLCPVFYILHYIKDRYGKTRKSTAKNGKV